MIKSASQLKGKIKNLANGDVRKAETLMRIFFMERFIERVSVSEYREKFILKGGMLTSSLLGIDMRTTMDIDTTVRSLPLTDEDIQRIIAEIISIQLDDGISFKIVSTERIMDEFDYPGVKVHLEGVLEGIRQPIKIDVSTDDVITPGAIEYEYKLMFEDRTIKLLSYNTETLLAEKMQTIIARGIANTRMRDFYDVYMIVLDVDFSWDILKEAFIATCQKRSTDYSDERVSRELELIDKDAKLEADWNKFKKKNFFAETLEWRTVIDSIEDSIKKVVS
ncbi:Nucleotidyl transferase AbiEii toxin, Type IV TA system [Butyrivibrio fibrisolvens]|uniref:Nucleotidyl transferase AbiEii toxin, Type IV TA system n=1 Tax=Butyrivibrio fibrisolvens TaxID=831 RepID=A0A1H9W826_BUTFI|nr:nucleotidyl transferase AbiEii/AbiGii toxin family protein [Butyrivibrio fibrisolvens]SES29984.1 Nucleotidyl transferase AbiEii toxin, Type IV TA system [Butyrivibrio fibrisolvens]